MSLRTIKKAPIVRLPPKSNFEIFFSRMSQVATIVVGLVTFIFALKMGEFILAPITLGIVIGLMLGPVATKLEYKGLRPGLSAFLVVMLFIIVVSLFAVAVAAPLSYWIDRLPQIWTDLQKQLADLKGPFEALKGMRGQLKEITGGDGLAVSVDEGMGVYSIAMLAPSLIAQILLFFASLYFFVATRHETRITVLSLCFSRRLRWRVAHIFRDVEHVISKYLLSITIINILEGLAVGIALYLIGIPSAPLWGAIAILTNFVVFIGPAVMVVILFAIGLTEFDSLGGSMIPVLVYLAINTIEAQFVTPMVIGRTMTLNPFTVLLSLAFWIWLWGALGGFIAVPALLIVYAIIRNIIPVADWQADGRAL
jgi:predicted PurR-regulated permease PerM